MGTCRGIGAAVPIRGLAPEQGNVRRPARGAAREQSWGLAGGQSLCDISFRAILI